MWLDSDSAKSWLDPDFTRKKFIWLWLGSNSKGLWLDSWLDTYDTTTSLVASVQTLHNSFGSTQLFKAPNISFLLDDVAWIIFARSCEVAKQCLTRTSLLIERCQMRTDLLNFVYWLRHTLTQWCCYVATGKHPPEIVKPVHVIRTGFGTCVSK